MATIEQGSAGTAHAIVEEYRDASRELAELRPQFVAARQRWLAAKAAMQESGDRIVRERVRGMYPQYFNPKGGIRRGMQHQVETAEHAIWGVVWEGLGYTRALGQVERWYGYLDRIDDGA